MKIGREILCLDSFTRINLKGRYDGPQLSKRLRANIFKFQSNYVPYRGQSHKMTHADQLLLNLKEVLEAKFGSNVLTHILPHYQRPDVICCFDENGNPVTDKFLDCFPPRNSGEILSKEFLLSRDEKLAAEMGNCQMLAVILGGWNFYLRDTNVPTGGLRMKLEQLEMIGYKTVLVHWSTWKNLRMDEKEKFIEAEVRKALSSDVDKKEEKIN